MSAIEYVSEFATREVVAICEEKKIEKGVPSNPCLYLRFCPKIYHSFCQRTGVFGGRTGSMKRVGFLLNSQIFAAHHQRLDSIIVLHRCQLLRTSAGYLRWEKGGKTDVWFLLVAHSQTGKSTKSTDGWTIEHSCTLLG